MAVFELEKQFHPDFGTPQKKPVDSLAVDWDNPLARGLMFATPLQQHNPIDLVNGLRGVLLNGASYDRQEAGNPVVDYDGTNDVIDFGLASRHSVDFSHPDGFTYVFIGGRDGTSAGTYFSKRDGGTAEIQLFTGTTSLSLNIGGATDTITGSGGSPQDTRAVFGGSGVGGSFDGYFDGEISITGVATNVPVRQDINLSVGARWQSYPATQYRINGWSEALFLWRRVLSPAEHKAIANDPYQILKPAIPVTFISPVEEVAGAGIRNPLCGPLILRNPLGANNVSR